MKKRSATNFVLLPLLMVSLYLGACSEESSQNTEGVANRVEVELGGGSISFLLPEGFHEFTGEKTTTKLSSHDGLQFAFGIEGMYANIIVSLTDTPAEESGIADYLSGMAEVISRGVPDYVELTNELREINGADWGRLEFQSNAFDIHMDNYITCLSGRSLMVNVYAAAGLYAEYRQDLIAAVESFELRGGC